MCLVISSLIHKYKTKVCFDVLIETKNVIRFSFFFPFDIWWWLLNFPSKTGTNNMILKESTSICYKLVLNLGITSHKVPSAGLYTLIYWNTYQNGGCPNWVNLVESRWRCNAISKWMKGSIVLNIDSKQDWHPQNRIWFVDISEYQMRSFTILSLLFH